MRSNHGVYIFRHLTIGASISIFINFVAINGCGGFKHGCDTALTVSINFIFGDKGGAGIVNVNPLSITVYFAPQTFRKFTLSGNIYTMPKAPVTSNPCMLPLKFFSATMWCLPSPAITGICPSSATPMKFNAG